MVRAMLRGTSPAMLHQEGTIALPLSESPRLSVSHSEDHYEWKDNITALALTSQGEDTPKVAYKVEEGSQNDESDFDEVDYRIPMKGKEKWNAAVTSESMGEDSERTVPQIEKPFLRRPQNVDSREGKDKSALWKSVTLQDREEERRRIF